MTDPTRAEIDASTGPLLLEFGNDWCGYCQAARPHILGALAAVPGIPHRKVADGPGQPFGRSYRVKLWPTLIVLKDGEERARLVRPSSRDEIVDALRKVQ